jgi:hypothetical protein
MNHASLVHYIGSDHNSDRPIPRRRVSSDPCLPERLPTTSKWLLDDSQIFVLTFHLNSGFLQREAEIDAPKAILRQLRRSPTPSPPNSPNLETEENSMTEEENPGRQRRPSLTSLASSASSIRSFGSSLIQHGQDKAHSSWKEPQASLISFGDA